MSSKRGEIRTRFLEKKDDVVFDVRSSVSRWFAQAILSGTASVKRMTKLHSINHDNSCIKNRLFIKL